MSKKLLAIVSLLILASMVLSACGPRVGEGTVATGDVVTSYGYSTTDIANPGSPERRRCCFN